MEVDKAILTRMSVKKFTDQAVPREYIDECLNLAVWAPNHKLTEPWRFRVITEGGRNAFADVVCEQIAADHSDHSGFRSLLSGSVKLAASIKTSIAEERVRSKILSAPVLIAVYSLRGDNERVTRENFAATAAGVQNILLGAHHRGLAAIWRSEEYYMRNKVREFLQVPMESDFVAAIYLGYSAQHEMTRKRIPAKQWTVWLDGPVASAPTATLEQ